MDIYLKDGDAWLISQDSIGARWTLECCGCGRRHQFQLATADEPDAYLITVTHAEEEPMNWKTQDGRSIPVAEMGTEHIESALAMLQREGYISPKAVIFFLTCPIPQGEMALDAFSRELDGLLDKPISLFIDLFEEELEKRRIAD